MVIFDRILQKTFWAHFEVELSFHYSIAKINSGHSNLKAEITLCPCIPLPFQTEKDGSHIYMTHAFSSTFFGFSL